MVISRARVVRTNGDASVRPTTIRPSVRAHSAAPVAVATPTSSQPSSGLASSKAGTPPVTFPTLPSSTQLASPSNQGVPSTSIVVGVAERETCCMPVQK
jgi:hypothetical protein